MCNLYSMIRNVDTNRRLFGAPAATPKRYAHRIGAG